jgi:hypothetical protein
VTIALISPEYLKTFLPVRAGNSDFDDRIRSIITAVTAQIETACRRNFSRQVHTEYFSSSATSQLVYNVGGDDDTGLVYQSQEQSILLSGTPLDSTYDIQVWYDPVRSFADSTLLDPTTDYFVDYAGNRILLNLVTQSRRMAFKVIYRAGYATNAEGDALDAVPEDLKLACVMQAIYMWNRAFPENTGMANERDGSVRGTYFAIKGGLLPDVVALLAPYRRLIATRG